MDKKWMENQLPENAPKSLITWVMNTASEELGPDFLIFRAERIPMGPSLEEIMEWNDLKPRRYEWAARCTCTVCREDFVTKKVAKQNAILLASDEDGNVYTVEPGDIFGDYELSHLTMEYAFSGEQTICPLCASDVEVIHSSKLRGGRTKRVMVQTVQNVAGYTTILYWMVCRHLDEEGMDYTEAHPMEAYVLTEKGQLVRYTHVQRYSWGSYGVLPDWHMTRECKDENDAIYPDWRSVCNRKRGSLLYTEIPDMEGTTGEKTGLAEYVAAGGYGWVQYLKFWRQHRCIENLVKAGQAPLVAGIINKAYRYSYNVKSEMEKYVDLTERKPHRMLRISKEEFREMRNQGTELTVDTLDAYLRYQAAGGKMPINLFQAVATDFGIGGMNAVITIMRETPGVDMDKIARYLAKQSLRMKDAQYIVDTRRMIQQAFPGRELTEEELWPRNLAAAHDRMERILADQRRLKSQKEQEAYNQQFADVLEKYGQLQWTDGDLCVIIPRTAQELHHEGEVLRHCVGGYAQRHISGSDTIFFIRRYRRPERPYYTLDIKMNSGEPTEVQLHGYGNERHGIHKEKRHNIPKKVRTFVDRWEQEVLLTWYINQNKQMRKEKSA